MFLPRLFSSNPKDGPQKMETDRFTSPSLGLAREANKMIVRTKTSKVSKHRVTHASISLDPPLKLSIGRLWISKKTILLASSVFGRFRGPIYSIGSENMWSWSLSRPLPVPNSKHFDLLCPFPRTLQTLGPTAPISTSDFRSAMGEALGCGGLISEQHLLDLEDRTKPRLAQSTFFGTWTLSQEGAAMLGVCLCCVFGKVVKGKPMVKHTCCPGLFIPRFSLPFIFAFSLFLHCHVWMLYPKHHWLLD